MIGKSRVVLVDLRPRHFSRAFSPASSQNCPAMFSLQKILSQDDTFFDLLEASAEEARHSVQVLNRLLAAPNNIPSLREFHLAKESDKKITDRINQALVSTFVTRLDREDIEMLSGILYKIP